MIYINIVVVDDVGGVGLIYLYVIVAIAEFAAPCLINNGLRGPLFQVLLSRNTIDCHGYVGGSRHRLVTRAIDALSVATMAAQRLAVVLQLGQIMVLDKFYLATDIPLHRA